MISNTTQPKLGYNLLKILSENAELLRADIRNSAISLVNHNGEVLGVETEEIIISEF